jgi:hypothetical protein
MRIRCNRDKVKPKGWEEGVQAEGSGFRKFNGSAVHRLKRRPSWPPALQKKSPGLFMEAR